VVWIRSDAPHIAGAHDGDVERRLEPVPVEAVERSGRGTARHHVAAEVEHQRTQIGERAWWSAGEPKRVGADFQEGTARDSAPKLCVGQPNAVRLLS